MIPFFSEKWKQAENWMKSIAFPAIQNALFKNQSLEEPARQILCVDDDRSFCLFIQRVGRSLGIQVDIVYSCEEARNAIEHTQYQAFIIDGHLPDGSGFELVAWIREKKGLGIPIGFISRIYQDAGSFRILKDSLKVDYVLEKPIHPSQVHQFLIQLCRLKSGPSTQKPFSDHLLADLKANYQKTIPDKIERLEKMILAIQKHPTIENLQSLRIEVHKIAGSAGSYGYPAVSEICKNLELELIQQIDFAKQGILNPEWFFSLDDFFTQIKLHYQIELAESAVQNTLKLRHLPSVYVMSENQEDLEAIHSSRQELDFNILVESRPDRAIQSLLSADFYPQIFLVDPRYPTSILTGYDLIKAFYQKKEDRATTVAMIVEEQNRGQIIEALQRGINVIIEKPFSPILVLSYLNQIPFRPFPLSYKVLVVDDDHDICQFISNSLKYKKLEVRALQDFHDLHAVLSLYEPDLILLNIHLIDESGVRIIEYLRETLRYKKLLIGILSITPEDTYLIQKCYDFNVDEILFKPLEEGILQKKIGYLLKREVDKELRAKKDPVTGLEDHQTFKRYLKEVLNQFHLLCPQVVVMFEIESFSTLTQQLEQEVIECVSKALEELLKKYEMATYLGERCFALIFQGYDPYFVQLFTRSFLNRLQFNLQKSVMQGGDLQINGAMVVLSQREEVESVVRRGRHLLSLARDSKEKNIHFIVDSLSLTSKQVVILGDERQTMGDVEKLFKDQGFQVRVSSNEKEEAIDLSSSSPLLLLITHSFLEAKGTSVLEKVFKESQIQVPILDLSHAPKGKDLQELLSQIDYFNFPFNLLIII